MEAFLHAIVFLLTLVGAFFLPGWVWWCALFGRTFSTWEEIVYAFLGSITLIDLTMLILGRVGAPLSAFTIGACLLTLTVIGAVFVWKKRSFHPQALALSDSALSFSSRGAWIFLGLCLLTLFVRTIYLTPTILPSATDLGHHTYWVNQIVATQSLPVYQKIEVVTDPATGNTSIAEPQPIVDFIVGEHLPLAFFEMVSGLSVFSASPTLFLHLVNLLSILAVMVLAWRLALPYRDRLNPEHVALLTFLILGPLFALASPQAKFVTGGVVGNLFGNLLIPAILLLLYRAFVEKSPRTLATAITLAFILAYTHHLSTLVLAFVLFGIGFLMAAFFIINRQPFLHDWFRLLASPIVLSTLFFALVFMALVALPSYIDTQAIDSAIGTPTKTTRTGLTFLQVSNSLGAAKVALGFFGLGLMLFSFRRRSIETAVIVGYGGLLTLMAMYPHLLLLDIPSSRIGSYLAYPLGLAAGFALAWMLYQLGRFPHALPPRLLTLVITLVVVFLLSSGSQENADGLSSKDRGSEIVQTFAASDYLATFADGQLILKDHNYLAADAWMKTFFQRDYGYPLSRGLFGRYEEGGNRRERCTLSMISTPNTEAGIRCYDETGVRYLVVNPVYDRAQFEKSDSFSKLYTSQTAAVFERSER